MHHWILPEENMADWTLGKQSALTPSLFSDQSKPVDKSRALWGSWAQSLSVSLISLVKGNSLHSASMTLPELQGAGNNSKQLLIR